MPIRISGMTSGLDTEALVSELVSAYRLKSQKYTKAQTKLSWKQDAWKGLNSKVSSFYSKLTSLKYSTAYNLKTATVSDSSRATVKAGSTAINGTYEVKINQVAKSGYLTGARIDGITDSSTLSSLGYTGGDGTVTVNVNGKKKDIAINGDMKVSEFVAKLNGSGVKANFDAANRRIFVASTATGAVNNFQLTGSDANGASALLALGLRAQGAEDTAGYRALVDYAQANGLDGSDTTKIQEILDKLASNTETIAKKEAQLRYADAYKTVQDAEKASRAAGGSIADLKDLLKNNDSKIYYSKDGAKEYEKTDDGKYKEKGTDNAYTKEELEKSGITLKSRLELLEEKAGFTKEIDVEKKQDDGTTLKTKETVIDPDKVKAYQAALNTAADYEKEIEKEDGTKVRPNDKEIAEIRTAYADADPNAFQAQTDQLKQDVTDAKTYLSDHALLNVGANAESLAARIRYAVDRVNNTNDIGYSTDAAGTNKGAANYIAGQDAVIEINGAEFQSVSNEITVNGLTINALAETGGSAISVIVGNNTQGLYDKVKSIVKDYNELINEMTKLYNAGSAKGYEPLTKEEKDALTDTEVEEWEKKIKDSLLRRDETLGSLLNGMSSAMIRSYNINGKNYSLSSFGIHTMGILNSAANEQNSFHIDGDQSDSLTASNPDKLTEALLSDPDGVVDFFKKLTSGVYDVINKKMSSSTLSSFNVVYNDKEMAREYSDYTKTVSKWEEKLKSIEDSYYKKFAAMESALAKMQSQQSHFASMFGG